MKRGFTLVEVVTAVTVTAVLAVLLWGAFAAAAHRLRDRSERMGLTHSLRVGSEALRSALEDLGADSTTGADLVGFAGDRVRYRAVRVAGIACRLTASRVVLRSAATTARRLPVAGRDSAMVLALDSSFRWTVAPVTGSPAPATCPDGGAGLAIPVALDSVLARAGPGSPVRIFEVVEARRYASSGLEWLGLQGVSAGDVVQPLAGPLSGSGLVVLPTDSTGSPAGSPTLAAAIAFLVAGASHRETGVGIDRRGARSADSVTSFVFLRNR